MTLIRSKFPGWTGLSSLFEYDFFSNATAEWSPAINVVDNEKNYEIEFAAPGMKKEEFNLKVENGVLSIKGESKREKEENDKNYTRREFSSRSFSKSFSLPANVSDDAVEARYEDGVLHITLHKTNETPSKKEISVK